MTTGRSHLTERPYHLRSTLRQVIAVQGSGAREPMAGAASGKCRLQLQPVLGARQLPLVLSVVLAVRHALVSVIAVAVARRREAHLDLLELERRDVLEDLLREVCRREDRE